jgi:glycosyltransferase involved in cell wall biosynthesis
LHLKKTIMRIGIDCRAIRNFTDGMGKYSKRLIEKLAEIDKENHYILFFRNDYQGSKAFGSNFTSVDIPYSHLSWQTMFLMARVIKRYQLDLYHAPFFLMPYGIDCKKIITVPDLMALKVSGFFSHRSFIGEQLAYCYHKMFVPGSIRRADSVMAISQATAKDIVKNIKKFRKKITVVHLGVDPQFKPVSKNVVDKVKRDYSITNSYFLYTGNTKPYKNIKGLLLGYHQYVKKGGQAQLKLISYRDRFRDELVARVKAMGLQGRVFFMDNVPNSDLPALMCGAIAFIFPSIYEGFGLPVVEAMACGCPVIASDIPSLKEIAGNASLQVSPYDPYALCKAMNEVENNTILRAEFVKKGFENSKRFSWEQYAQQTLDCYNTLRS